MNIEPMLNTGYSRIDGLFVPENMRDKTVWDTLAVENLFDATTSATSEAHVDEKSESQIADLEREANEGVFLDLGCGYGRIAEQLLSRRSFTAYIGVDSALQMLAYARDRKKDKPPTDTPLFWVYGEIDAIPLKDASVDTVAVSAVFLHNHKSVVHRSMKEIMRVLKPGGKVLVFSSFPNQSSLMGLQGTLYLWFLKLRGQEHRNGPVRYYGKGEVQRLFSGFSEVSIVPYGFAILPKRIIVFPSVIDMVYRRCIAKPINTVISFLLPPLRSLQPSHHDVVAVK